MNAEIVRFAIDRLGYGPRPGDLDYIASLGVERWIDQQLNPQSLPFPAELQRQMDDLATRHLSAADAFISYGPPSYRPPGGGKPDPEQAKAARERARILATEAAEARLLLAIESPRQLQERLVEFWFNHFNVFAGKGLDHLWMSAYENEAIRPHVLGKFRDLLGATAKHPAMLFYLDNWQNTGPESVVAERREYGLFAERRENGPAERRGDGPFKGLNENYAREVMELHTLGVNGGYTQDDVIALARILTGWGFPPNRAEMATAPGLFGRMMRGRRFMRMAAANRGAFYFDPDRHDTGDKSLLGRRVAGRNGSAGIREGEEALDHLAQSPATAQHIAYKLAQFFVADEPNPDLVTTLARTFRETDGDLRAVTRALLHSDVFTAAPAAPRFKTPYQYVLSAVRASGVTVRNIRPLYGTLAQLGQPLYGCQTPDGFKCTTDAWLNPDAMTRRISFAVALGAGRLPLETATDPRINVRNPQRMAAMPAADTALRDGTAVDADVLLGAVGSRFSANTLRAVNDAPPPLRSGLLLGSPEFMTC